MVDASSRSSDGYYQIQNFVKDVIRGLRIGDDGSRIAYGMFTDEANIQFDFDAYETKMELVNAVSFPHEYGITNTTSALELVLNQGFQNARENSRKIVVLIVDGRGIDHDTAFYLASQVKEQGITILGVGVNTGGRFGRQELMSLTSDPDDLNFLEAESYTELSRHVDTLVENLCKGVCYFYLKHPGPKDQYYVTYFKILRI